jgi:F-type H+-transporting ATPase subunit b
MKKLLFIALSLAPVAIFASDSHVQTDIIERTVNFIIFASIAYYVLADKARAFFGDRSASIQSELEKVKDLKVQSEAKRAEAQDKLDNAKALALELVEDAKSDIESIKNQIAANTEQEIAQLSKSFDDKCNVEMKKMKNEVVEEILNELMSEDNMSITQDNLTSIILNKVA